MKRLTILPVCTRDILAAVCVPTLVGDALRLGAPLPEAGTIAGELELGEFPVPGPFTLAPSGARPHVGHGPSGMLDEAAAPASGEPAVWPDAAPGASGASAALPAPMPAFLEAGVLRRLLVAHGSPSFRT